MNTETKFKIEFLKRDIEHITERRLRIASQILDLQDEAERLSDERDILQRELDSINTAPAD